MAERLHWRQQNELNAPGIMDAKIMGMTLIMNVHCATRSQDYCFTYSSRRAPALHVESKSHIYAILSGVIISLFENEQPLISHRYF